MIFTTYWFLISVSIFLLLYWITPISKMRFGLLLLYCFLFHSHFAGPSGMLPIMVLTLITFLIGRTANRHLCSLGIFLCVFALCFYKYSHFFETEIVALFGAETQGLFASFLNKVLPEAPPLAISFFVFEFVHYLFEVRKGGAPIRNIFEFMQFSIFFPSLVSGPIKRYGQFMPSLKEGLTAQLPSDRMLGFLQVLLGFGQKVLLADNLANYIVTTAPIFDRIELYERWIFLFVLALRIYFDFNGYSDIAIGLARMLGIKLPQNFKHPYVARNIKDFWQRWHISLSTWIKDYVYVPLGGGRHGKLRTVTNGLIAFTLCGLWHGAAWHFALWGIYHGIGLSICNSYKNFPIIKNLAILMERVPILSWAVTFLFVCFGWLLFFYPVPEALNMFRLLFSGYKNET